ncbi:hypothetical protein LWI29_006504 [Acer saccharum]|uniref:Uncharacterized protein n=1 Tax=Acer saccharum TaxID=4024 RepID=A0AA39VHN6_ACESA|nr:hypothetical protein LWI29_006504 [Acer saccharum]
MEEAGLNPKISCSGTPMEMVCPGGEKAFIPHIIEDSVALKQTFRYYSFLPSYPYPSFTITVFLIFSMENEPSCFMISRWFTSMLGQKLNLKILTSKLWEVGATVVKTTEFVQGQACRWDLAWTFMPPTRKIISPHVIEKKNSSFMLEITASKDHCNAILKNEVNDVDEAPSDKHLQETSSLSANPWNISGERIFTALRYPIPRIILINIPTIGGRSES